MTKKPTNAVDDLKSFGEDDELDYGVLKGMNGVALQRAYYSTLKYFSKTLGDEFKPGRYTILIIIQRNPGLTQKSLAKAIRRDASTLVPILDELNKNGWVVRKRSETDRRAHALHLTTAGVAVAKRLDKKIKAIETMVSEKMGVSESRQLLNLLDKFQRLFEHQLKEADD
jgi:DNA-binding MarR family transcriptional regulator